MHCNSCAKGSFSQQWRSCVMRDCSWRSLSCYAQCNRCTKRSIGLQKLQHRYIAGREFMQSRRGSEKKQHAVQGLPREEVAERRGTSAKSSLKK